MNDDILHSIRLSDVRSNTIQVDTNGRLLGPGMLSDRDLIREIERGNIVIDPLTDPETQIQPASIDLRLGNEISYYLESSTYRHIDPRDKTSIRVHTEIIPDDGFTLNPLQFYLGSTMERVKVPPNMVAQINGRSSVGRPGIVVENAGFVDPGFEGQITLEMFNFNSIGVKLYPGMRICQICYQYLSSPALRPYGSERGSKYQGQQGPTASRIYQDKENVKS